MERHIAISVALVTLLLPAAAWACPPDTGFMFGLGGLVALAGLALFSLGALIVQCFLSGSEGYYAQVVDRPKFFFIRLVLMGIPGLFLGILAALTVEHFARYGADGIIATLLLTSPLVAQSAYGAHTWHRHRRPL